MVGNQVLAQDWFRIAEPEPGVFMIEAPPEPALLPAMRDALDEVARGRAADRFEESVATHAIAGFAVRVAAGATRAGES